MAFSGIGVALNRITVDERKNRQHGISSPLIIKFCAKFQHLTGLHAGFQHNE